MAGSYFSNDTIAAIATSVASDAGVGIIRVSGKNAKEIGVLLDSSFKFDPPRYLNRVLIRNRNGEILDDGLSVYFQEGNSFTGEDVVELQLHGGRHVLQSILQEILSTGLCRLALPGEFSFRAVKNGKLSLDGARALQQIIVAKSDIEVRIARNTLSADRTKEFHQIGERIKDLLAKVELSIDFVDQDVEVINSAELETELRDLLTLIEHLERKLLAAKRVAQGFQIVLLGEPNAGKSTLFNAFLAEDRAIVSPQAGTTRDVITEEILVGPYRLRLADTAGIRGAQDRIESEGVERALALAKTADIVLHIVDGSTDFSAALEKLDAQGLPNSIIVFTKVDLVKDRMHSVPSAVYVSARTGEGIADLLAAIERKLDSRYGEAKTAFLATEYQMSMVQECKRWLTSTVELVAARELKDPELVSSGLRSAAQALSDMVGETTPDTVLTKIFSEFCIGK